MKTYVYFISDGHGHTKIGVSDNPQKRLKQCQTGNPYKLKLERTEVFESRNDALEREKELHNKFKDFNTHGEWFQTSLTETFYKYDSPTYENYIDVVLTRNMHLI